MPLTLNLNFGEYRPDLIAHTSPGLVISGAASVTSTGYRSIEAPYGSPSLVDCSGVYAGANGYRPIGSFAQFANALPGTFKGGGSFIGTAGDARMIAGSVTDLYSGDSGSWSSKVGGFSVNTRWRFTQFGDDIICVNGGAPVRFSLAGNTAALLSGSPPTADFCATVRDFVVMGRADGLQNEVRWSGQGDATTWTIGVKQAGLQPIYAGGKIMGLTSGEVCYIIQRFQVTRMSYTGDATDPWQFDAISTNNGCRAEGSVWQVGELHGFLGDRGFVMWNGAQYQPIGIDKIDATFHAAYSDTDLANLWTTVDPSRTLVIWIIQGKLWMYNWTMDRWAIASLPVIAGFTAFTQGVSIDALDAIYGNLDAIPYSLDDPRFSGGTPRLTVVNANGTFGALSGSNIAARLQLPLMEIGARQIARVNRIRPISDATSNVALTVDSRQRLGDAESISTYAQLTDRGDMPTRIAARSIGLTLAINAGAAWSYCQGIEINFSTGGRK
jgi:hypothetical protein